LSDAYQYDTARIVYLHWLRCFPPYFSTARLEQPLKLHQFNGWQSVRLIGIGFASTSLSDTHMIGSAGKKAMAADRVAASVPSQELASKGDRYDVSIPKMLSIAAHPIDRTSRRFYLRGGHLWTLSRPILPCAEFFTVRFGAGRSGSKSAGDIRDCVHGQQTCERGGRRENAQPRGTGFRAGCPIQRRLEHAAAQLMGLRQIPAVFQLTPLSLKRNSTQVSHFVR